jgi:hypothetical protein
MCVTVFFLLLCLIFPTACGTKNKFANDPVKWTFISGDGSWDNNLRRWTIYLPTGQTKSAAIQLDNTSSARVEVNVLPQSPSDTVFAGGGERYTMPGQSSVRITITAQVYAPWGPGTYTIDYGGSYIIR